MCMTLASELLWATKKEKRAVPAFNVENMESIQGVVTAALHLDHGSSGEMAMAAMEAGYTSVMYDGSRLYLEENIRCTRQVTAFGRQRGVPVEAELGCVGGKEEDVQESVQMLTSLEEAVMFVRETGIDSLAVAIGTSHGFYKGVPRINVERLQEIRSRIDIPLVLHGTSGVPADTVRACIRHGICKVNYATDLRQGSMAKCPCVMETILSKCSVCR